MKPFLSGKGQFRHLIIVLAFVFNTIMSFTGKGGEQANTTEQRSPADGYYVFTSFRGNGEDGLHLALSRDGYHWTALNHNQPLLRPEVGEHKLMRDPCLAQGPDGVFHMVWTTGWTADKKKVIGHAHSKDLIHWSPQQAI
jgi:hypothetical protein